MNYNGYRFDFACDPIITDDPDDGNDDDKPKDPNDKGNSIEDYNATKEKYESRFWDNFKPTDPENIAGYGVNKPWTPPISNPDTLLTIYDRYMLTSMEGYMPFLHAIMAWSHGFGPGDSWDGFFYNNPEASGSQLYPKGFAKYFDVYSVNGIVGYSFHYIWDLI